MNSLRTVLKGIRYLEAGSCFLLGIGLTSACRESAAPPREDRIIAQVGDNQLRERDLQGIGLAGVAKTDSLALIRRFIETWVRKELMLQEAQTHARLDDGEIERKVQDYRYSLVLYEFEKQYLQKNLDTLTPLALLKQYYQENMANFVLKQSIVQAAFVKMPRKSAQLSQVRSLLSARQPKAMKALASLCARHADQYYLNDSSWVDFEKLVTNTPWQSVANKAVFLHQRSQAEASDEAFVYLLRIRAARATGQTAPLEFAHEQIRSLILNQRKVTMVNELEKRVYERAKRNREFKIY